MEKRTLTCINCPLGCQIEVTLDGGKLVVEDVKSTATRTKEYLRNKKFMRSKYGIDIQEV